MPFAINHSVREHVSSYGLRGDLSMRNWIDARLAAEWAECLLMKGVLNLSMPHDSIDMWDVVLRVPQVAERARLRLIFTLQYPFAPPIAKLSSNFDVIRNEKTESCHLDSCFQEKEYIEMPVEQTWTPAKTAGTVIREAVHFICGALHGTFQHIAGEMPLHHAPKSYMRAQTALCIHRHVYGDPIASVGSISRKTSCAAVVGMNHWCWIIIEDSLEPPSGIWTVQLSILRWVRGEFTLICGYEDDARVVDAVDLQAKISLNSTGKRLREISRLDRDSEMFVSCPVLGGAATQTRKDFLTEAAIG